MELPTTTSDLEVRVDGDRVMTMLQEHVPLSLLCDLGVPDGPESAEILAEEGEPAEQWWLP